MIQESLCSNRFADISRQRNWENHQARKTSEAFLRAHCLQSRSHCPTKLLRCDDTSFGNTKTPSCLAKSASAALKGDCRRRRNSIFVVVPASLLTSHESLLTETASDKYRRSVGIAVKKVGPTLATASFKNVAG